MSEAVSYGNRIKYIIDGDIYTSHKIYSNGFKAVRVIVNKAEMSFKFIDPSSGETVYQFSKKVNNFEVLQRHVKRDLVKLLGISFSKETRNVTSE